MKNNLIFDVGMHKCEDSAFYLNRGFRVIAIDADIMLVQEARNKYKKYIEQGLFTVLNYAVAEKDDLDVNFYISQNTLWSSLNSDISERLDDTAKSVSVKTKRLGSLFQEYGTPNYCKIDIEGYDNACLKTLSAAPELPKFVSVESECMGKNEKFTEEDALATLHSLKNLGYTKFKLVDQRTLNVLKPNRKFYYKKSRLEKKIRRSIKKIVPTQARHAYAQRFNYQFPFGATGPFGHDTQGTWLNYKDAMETLIKHRKEYYVMENAIQYGFWCDWHAAL